MKTSPAYVRIASEAREILLGSFSDRCDKRKRGTSIIPGMEMPIPYSFYSEIYKESFVRKAKRSALESEETDLYAPE